MDIVEISKAVTAQESREIISIGLRMQFDALDFRDPLNYHREVTKLQAVALRYNLLELIQEFENDK